MRADWRDRANRRALWIAGQKLQYVDSPFDLSGLRGYLLTRQQHDCSRSAQTVKVSAAARRHQSFCEKISTSTRPR